MEHKVSFKIYKDMIEKGMTDSQAESYVNGLNSALDGVATKDDIEAFRLATKSDIESLRIDTKKDIESLRIDTKKDIENLEYRLENKIDSKFNILITLGAAMFFIHTQPVLEKIKESSPATLVWMGAFSLAAFFLYLIFNRKKK